jgi:hypothetical protein
MIDVYERRWRYLLSLGLVSGPYVAHEPDGSGPRAHVLNQEGYPEFDPELDDDLLTAVIDHANRERARQLDFGL